MPPNVHEDEESPKNIHTTTTTTTIHDSTILEGPDLNASRSPFDKKLYRQILLPNGLRVVLVSDTVALTQSYNSGGIYPDDGDDEDDSSDDVDDEEEEEDEDGASSMEHGLRNAAAAMVVGVGSYSDPTSCQGMAHFLEHLLFMGSQKYPEENAYDSFMSKHGGHDNAFTELEHTVYHFELPQEHLSSALDMFAQFFTAPLLLESSVERELQSIESEFQLAKNSDNARVEQLMCHTCGHAPTHHPFAKFSWGNLQSLKEDPKAHNVNPMDELKRFYKEVRTCTYRNETTLGGSSSSPFLLVARLFTYMYIILYVYYYN
jgi:nardilysin